MIKSLFIVGIGSFFGGVLRYYLSTLIKVAYINGFPWGTLIVNLLGCFVFGVIFALFNRWNSVESSFFLLLTTGFCGGFTTFSTFAHESIQMVQTGSYIAFFFYVTISVIVGLTLVGVGYWIVK